MSGGNSKKPYPTAEQKRRLLELLDSDPQLRSGKFSSTFTKKEAIRRWQAIAEDLNSISGTCKTGLEWRKTYQDKKSKAKKKAAVLRRSAQRVTGGGTPPPPINDEEEFLLGSMSQETLVGNDTLESEAVFDMDSQMEVVELEVATVSDPSAEQPQNIEGSHDVSLSASADAGVPVAATEATPMLNRERSRVGLQRTRTSAQRRLQNSIDTAQALRDSMATKIAIKKKIYNEFIQQMIKFTEAASSIAESLATIANKP